MRKIQFFSKMKISNRLTLLYTSLVILILLVFTAVTALSVYIYGNIRNERLLTHTATTIVNSITKREHLFENNWDDITVGNDLYIIIYSRDGEILRKSDALATDDDLIEDAELIIFGKVFRNGFFDDAAYINRSIMIDDEVFIVQIIKDYQSELYMIAYMSLTLLVLMIFGAFLSVFIGRKMSKQMLRPIAIMTENANNIQRGGVTSERLKVGDNKDEITDLGNTLNAMLDRIESYSKTLTQFVSDASHELRTPITIVLSYAEMLKKWAKDDPIALEKSINSIEKEALSMKLLVERLLTLARSDTKNLSMNLESFELSTFIEEVYEETKIIAPNKEIRLIKNDKLTINSDINHLKELLRIIIENAIKYTREDGVIELSSVLNGSNLAISIRDNGIGISELELGKIFDRFFCSEISRNKKRSGSGLGLSIAKALADELKFDISVKSKEGVFTEFLLEKVII